MLSVPLLGPMDFRDTDEKEYHQGEALLVTSHCETNEEILESLY